MHHFYIKLKPTKKKILITIAVYVIFQLISHFVPFYFVVRSNSMSPTFNRGDIIFVTGIAFENLKIGDIALFIDNYGKTVVHRVVAIDTTSKTFTAKGDANSVPIISETNVPSENLRGVVIGTIPVIGYLDLFYVGWIIRILIIYLIISLIIRD